MKKMQKVVNVRGAYNTKKEIRKIIRRQVAGEGGGDPRNQRNPKQSPSTGKATY